ncbi:MAG: fibronectin type III domain-containing protein [Lentisphaeria bacterium]|nr:fibronectin type III domain-containing protein [Lentisphaeria bacterium]
MTRYETSSRNGWSGISAAETVSGLLPGGDTLHVAASGFHSRQLELPEQGERIASPERQTAIRTINQAGVQPRAAARTVLPEAVVRSAAVAAVSGEPLFSFSADSGNLPPVSSADAASGDTLVPYLVPEAEYMYGCTPTAFGMILGYYDLYGYGGEDYSALIEGSIDVNSRGSDGNIYNMNEFNVLGSFIASHEYVERFYSKNGWDETTPEQELQYSFVNGGSGAVSQIDISVWNCLADYLGTSQYWRGNENLSTSYHYMTLGRILDYNSTVTIQGGGYTRTIDWRYTNMLYGLNLYIESCGYSLNPRETGTFRVDTYGGSFTFEDYMREIDAGRPVLISIKGHSMTGYGYNKATREIVFDDTYRSGQRMTWGGSYYYSGEQRVLQSITVLSLEGGGKVPASGLVIDKAYTATVETAEDVLVRASGSISAGYPAALQLNASGLTVTLEGGTLSCDSVRNAAILFGGDAYWTSEEYGPHYDGIVNFAGKQVTLSSTVSNCITAAGILGKNLTVDFTGAASGSQGIHITATCKTGPGNYFYAISADEELTVSGDFGGVTEITSDQSSFSALRQAECAVLQAGGSLTVKGNFVGTHTVRNVLGAAGRDSISAVSAGLRTGGSLMVTGSIGGSWSIRTESRAGAAAAGDTISAAGIYGYMVDIAAMDARMEIYAGGENAKDCVAYGIFSGFALNMGDFSGFLSAAAMADKGVAYGAKGTDVSGTFGGTVIANGRHDSYAIHAFSELNVTVTGILFSGYWAGGEDLASKLQNFSGNRQALLAAAEGRYAISSYGEDNKIALGEDSLVVGGIKFLGGSITLAGNASLYGDIESHEKADLFFSLNKTGAGHTFISAGKVSGGFKTIEIDVTGAGEGSYTLIGAPDLELPSITVKGGFGNRKAEIGEAFESGGWKYLVTADKNGLGLTVAKSGGVIPDPDPEPGPGPTPEPEPGDSTLVMNGTPEVSIQDNIVTVRWSPPTGAGTVYGYNVQVGRASYFTANRHYVLTLEDGDYTCSVQAVDQDGRLSNWTREKPFTVGDSEPPQLSGRPSVSVRGGTVTVSWSPAADNVGVEGYILKIGEKEYTVKETSYTLSLDPGTYHCTVLAYDAEGNRSDWAEKQSFTVSDTQVPEFSSDPKADVSGRDFTIHWRPATDNVAVAGYVVKLDGKEYEVKNGSSIVFRNQQPGTYTYQVKAYDAAGNYVWSESRSFRLEEKDIGVYFELLPGTVNGTQSVVLGDLNLKPGLYRLGGDFSGFSGKISIVNLVNGKAAGSAAVKNGVLNFRKPLLLDGAYRIQVAGAKGAAGDLSVELSGTVFYRADNSDDSITQLKDGHRITVDASPVTLIADEWVGYGDEFDYRAVTFSHAGKYTFDIASTDAVKMTVWALQPNGKLKAVKKASVKAGVPAGIAGCLMEAGTYYLSVQSSSAKKGGSADYSVKLGNSSVFFTRGDNSDDSITQLKDGHRITVDASPVTLIADEWVGYGDEFDYRAVTFSHAGKYTFDIASTDAVKMTVWALQPNGKLKAVKKASVKAGVPAGIAGCLLDAGTYYLSVQSSSAKKGGSADYSVKLNSSSVFFTRGNNSDDDPASLGGAYREELDGTSRRLISNDWVGYGDAADYRALTVARSGLYSFALSGATDAVKLTLFADDGSGKLKKLKSVSVKSGGGSIAALELEALQHCFVAIESTAAKKGGGTAYSLDVSFELPPVADAAALDAWQGGTAAAFDLGYGQMQLGGFDQAVTTAERFSLFEEGRKSFAQLA